MYVANNYARKQPTVTIFCYLLCGRLNCSSTVAAHIFIFILDFITVLVIRVMPSNAN